MPSFAVRWLLVVSLLSAAAPARALVFPTFELWSAPSGTTDEFAHEARGAVAPDGSLMIVWEYRQGVTLRLYAQRFSDHGVALGSATLLPSDQQSGFHGIVPAPAGGYLLVFDEQPHIVVRTLDAGGQVLGPEIVVDAATNADRALGGIIAAQPSGAVVVWREGDAIRGRTVDTTGQPMGQIFSVGFQGPNWHLAAAADGGFIVAAGNQARTFNPDGTPRAPTNTLPSPFSLEATATLDGGFAVIGIYKLIRLSPTGSILWTTVVGQQGAPSVLIDMAVAVDFEGNFQVAWAESDPDSTATFYIPARLRARGIDAAGVPLGPVFDLGAPRFTVHTIAVPDGRYLNTFEGFSELAANFSSTCGPSSTVCGNGVIYERCEECDDGGANSDVVPDACRTTCTLPRCTDTVVDSGEECDDGNTEACDGCSPACTIEPGLVCGDNLTASTCGEQCDDGNNGIGDGCTGQCLVEPIYGGGSATTDCFVEWSVNNPTNVPLLDPKGQFPNKQRCVDNDPLCDFDGGVAGSCTFRLRVCANNFNLLGRCAREPRLASWTLVKPSVKSALKDPAAANVRAAFDGVAGVIVGPTTLGICTDELSVPVPLRGSPGNYRSGKMSLQSAAAGYSGIVDKDKLLLTCAPQ
jgi:cysteine-rich repeat protein